MGPKCEEVCPEGFFGNNCLEVCTCNRKPNFVCHTAHGCVCKSGWRGKNCDESIYAASTAEEEGKTIKILTFVICMNQWLHDYMLFIGTNILRKVFIQRI